MIPEGTIYWIYVLCRFYSKWNTSKKFNNKDLGFSVVCNTIDLNIVVDQSDISIFSFHILV